MASLSKSQQQFMGMVYSLQNGELSPDEVSQDVRDAAANMKKKDVKDFASTKHKNLPKKVKEYSFVGDKHTKGEDDEDFPHGKAYRTNESLVMKTSNPSTISMLSQVLPSLKGMDQSKRKVILKDLIKTINNFYEEHGMDVRIK